ncbi:MAG: GNAT family N-acetyltransferase [Holophagae bacterium]|jgi:ribosomal protein S18 acetylase RimI-like enzyme
MTDDLIFVRLDHTAPAVSEEVSALLRRSYAIEAELISVEDFPPLRRTAEDVRETPSTFIGCTSENRLVAVAELEPDGEHVNIAGFVVHPDDFRRGIGSRLLHHVLESYQRRSITVSTAAANGPAISLYERHGFSISNRWAIDGIDMVTLNFSPSGA